MNKLFLTIALTVWIQILAARDFSTRWDNNVLRGYICTIDSVENLENGQAVFQQTKRPLETAAVLLFKSKREAEAVRYKFEGMANLYDSLKSSRDSAYQVYQNSYFFSRVSGKIRNFTRQADNRAVAEKINAALDSSGARMGRRDSTFISGWLTMFKDIDYAYNEECREISAVTRFGAETDPNGRFDILTSENDKSELRWLLAGMMGYDFSLQEISTALPDTIFLTEKIFSFRKVEKIDVADEPFKPVYISKNINYYDNRPQIHEFDRKPYFQNVLKPVDLSIGFLDYCWYYTYNTGAYIGRAFTSAGQPETEAKKEDK